MLHTVRRFEIVDHRSAFFGLEITVIWEKKCIEMHLFNYWYSLSVHHPPAGRPGPHTKLKTFLHEVLHQAPWPAMDHTKPHAPYTDHPHPETRPRDRVGPPTPHERSTAQPRIPQSLSPHAHLLHPTPPLHVTLATCTPTQSPLNSTLPTVLYPKDAQFNFAIWIHFTYSSWNKLIMGIWSASALGNSALMVL